MNVIEVRKKQRPILEKFITWNLEEQTFLISALLGVIQEQQPQELVNEMIEAIYEVFGEDKI
jgi:hypothetical protein